MPVVLINARGLSDAAHGLTIAALIIFFLYLAGVIVQPLAIAALLSFILAPVMRRLRIWGLPKVVSALFSVALTLTAIGALGTTLVMQGRQLAEDLPKYENNFARRYKGSVVRRSLRASLSGQAERCAICGTNSIVLRTLRHHHRSRSLMVPNRSPSRSTNPKLRGSKH